MTRLKPTRDAYIRKDYQEILRDDALGVLVLADASGDVVQAFGGRRQEPDFHKRFRNKERADFYVDAWYKGIQQSELAKVERRAALRDAPNTLQLGDILKTTWGYEQTNVDYYQVTAVFGKSVEVREIDAKVVKTTGDMSGQCVPVPDQFIGLAMRKRVDARGAVKFPSTGGWAYKKMFTIVDGVKVFEPDSFTTYG